MSSLTSRSYILFSLFIMLCILQPVMGSDHGLDSFRPSQVSVTTIDGGSYHVIDVFCNQGDNLTGTVRVVEGPSVIFVVLDNNSLDTLVRFGTIDSPQYNTTVTDLELFQIPIPITRVWYIVLVNEHTDSQVVVETIYVRVEGPQSIANRLFLETTIVFLILIGILAAYQIYRVIRRTRIDYPARKRIEFKACPRCAARIFAPIPNSCPSCGYEFDWEKWGRFRFDHVTRSWVLNKLRKLPKKLITISIACILIVATLYVNIYIANTFWQNTTSFEFQQPVLEEEGLLDAEITIGYLKDTVVNITTHSEPELSYFVKMTMREPCTINWSFIVTQQIVRNNVTGDRYSLYIDSRFLDHDRELRVSYLDIYVSNLMMYHIFLQGENITYV
ncbi:MAG: hypothetical protein RTU92_10275 [Candidatus Thorarchaeota archaeon]